MTARFGTTSALRRLTIIAAGIAVALALPSVAQAKQVKIVIDPGHGGKDPGAMSTGVMEKRINLQISRAVAKEARRQGWKVVMTRNSDRFIPLVKRPAKASAVHADAFVSIHMNSTGKRAKGSMTIYRGKQSGKLGRAIMSELAPMTPYKDIGAHSDVRGLAVLRASKKPAVIVEVLSVTAPRERDRLQDPKEQKAYARAIVRGIAKYRHVRYKPMPMAKSAPVVTPSTPAVEQTPTPTNEPLHAETVTTFTSKPAPRGFLPRIMSLFR